MKLLLPIALFIAFGSYGWSQTTTAPKAMKPGAPVTQPLPNAELTKEEGLEIQVMQLRDQLLAAQILNAQAQNTEVTRQITEEIMKAHKWDPKTMQFNRTTWQFERRTASPQEVAPQK